MKHPKINCNGHAVKQTAHVSCGSIPCAWCAAARTRTATLLPDGRVLNYVARPGSDEEDYSDGDHLGAAAPLVGEPEDEEEDEQEEVEDDER